MNILRHYQRLIRLLDRKIRRIERSLSPDMNCHPGCACCCENLSLLPVEWAAVRQGLHASGLKPLFRSDRTCGFLDDENRCQIYPFRPVICRTHGLPLAYESGEEWEIHICPWNLTDYRSGLKQLNRRQILNMERVNTALARLNKKYLRAVEYSGPQRRPMSDLLQYLNPLFPMNSRSME